MIQFPKRDEYAASPCNRNEEDRRDAHHILLDLDAIGESIIPEARSIEFIKKHGDALREILRKASGL